MSEAYYHTKESVAEYIQLAKDVSGKLLINEMRQYLPNNCRVLELGSGPGKDWEILHEEYQVIGSDFSLEFLERLRSKHPKGTFIELDAATMRTKLHFDGIYSNKVLHHLSNDELSNSIIRQEALLNYNGIICHSFWKGQGREDFKGMLVNYHDEDDLQRLFSPKFEILELISYAEFEENDSVLLIARKKD